MQLGSYKTVKCDSVALSFLITEAMTNNKCFCVWFIRFWANVFHSNRYSKIIIINNIRKWGKRRRRKSRSSSGNSCCSGGSSCGCSCHTDCVTGILVGSTPQPLGFQGRAPDCEMKVDGGAQLLKYGPSPRHQRIPAWGLQYLFSS